MNKVLKIYSRIIPSFIKKSDGSIPQAIGNLHVFYYLVSVVAFLSLADLTEMLHLSLLPLWPIQWINFIDLGNGMILIHVLFVLFSFGTAFNPSIRLLRMGTLVSLFFWVALKSSLGKIDHNYHVLIYVAFLLILLPERWNYLSLLNNKREVEIKLVYWGCQATVLLTYFLSGFWKVVDGLGQVYQGQVSMFNLEGPAIQVAAKLLTLQEPSLMGSYAISMPMLIWPSYLFTVILELSSVIVLYKSRFQKIWALGIILMHLGIYLVMGIPFAANIFVVMLLFFNTPFQKTLSVLRQSV